MFLIARLLPLSASTSSLPFTPATMALALRTTVRSASSTISVSVTTRAGSTSARAAYASTAARMASRLEASTTERRAAPAEGLGVRGEAAGGVAFFLRAVGGVSLAAGFGDGASVLGAGAMGVSGASVVSAMRADFLQILVRWPGQQFFHQMDSTSIGVYCKNVL